MTIPTQITHVIYNAANQMFEATVTIHEPDGTARYACAIPGAIDMSFDDASAALSEEARRLHVSGSAMRSVLVPAKRALRDAMKRARDARTHTKPRSLFGPRAA